MNAADFRVGNAVLYYKPFESEPAQGRISEILYRYDIDMMSVTFRGNPSFALNIEKGVIPIDLDVRWLKRMHFEQMQHGNYRSRRWFLADYIEANVRMYLMKEKGIYSAYLSGLHLTRLRYVHQVQNLFYALNQRDLPITEP